MGDRAHEHDHRSVAAADRRLLATVLALTTVFMVVELVGGLIAHSLVLLADATHMLTDVASLSLALFAMWAASKPATPERSYGYHRTEILAALVNGVLLAVLTVFIFREAVLRLYEPPAVRSGIVIGMGCAGLGVNLVGVSILRGRRRESLNIESAFLHVLSDALGSMGAIVAGLIIWRTGWYQADPLISFLMGGLIVRGTWRVLARTVNVLLEACPVHINVDAVRGALLAEEGVLEIHDLHVWTITSGKESLSSHLLIDPNADANQVLDRLTRMLRERFGIEHSTIQLETRSLEDLEPDFF